MMIGCQGLLKLSIDGATNDTFYQRRYDETIDMVPNFNNEYVSNDLKSWYQPQRWYQIQSWYQLQRLVLVLNLVPTSKVIPITKLVCTDFNIGTNF